MFFILDGAKDTRHAAAGIGLFPVFIRSEFHAIRSTIEAFSRSARRENFDTASACGIRLQKGQAKLAGENTSWNATFRVVSNDQSTEYLLDRWD